LALSGSLISKENEFPGGVKRLHLFNSFVEGLPLDRLIGLLLPNIKGRGVYNVTIAVSHPILLA
jgi:hypothetical protein